MDADEVESGRIRRYEEELASFRRYLRFMVLTLIFWFAMLYFIAHGDGAFIIAGVVLLILSVLYMCVYIICGDVCWRFQDRQRDNFFSDDDDDDDDDQDDDDDDEEEAGLTAASPKGRVAFPYSFAETPQKVRACSQLVRAGEAPTNGIYKAVFSAIFFNKPLRSEGKLRLEFLPTHDNGWTVQGESNFGRNSHVLQDAFVNAKGEMYWTAGESIHRGVLDFAQSTMFNGEFVAVGKKWLLSKNDTSPMGRIVRLELERASFYSHNRTSSDVEMVSFTQNDDNDKVGSEGERLFT